MKRLLPIVLALCNVFLAGCSKQSSVETALELREKILSAQGCTFQTVITADYGDSVYTFRMQCIFDNIGNLMFTVMEPESISGITGSISSEVGKLTFDDQILVFDLLADDQLTPVSAPWVLMKAIRGGYIHSVAQNEAGVQIYIDDSYENDAMQLDIRLNREQLPVYAEILWKNRRILSIQVMEFYIL